MRLWSPPKRYSGEGAMPETDAPSDASSPPLVAQPRKGTASYTRVSVVANFRIRRSHDSCNASLEFSPERNRLLEAE